MATDGESSLMHTRTGRHVTTYCVQASDNSTRAEWWLHANFMSELNEYTVHNMLHMPQY